MVQCASFTAKHIGVTVKCWHAFEQAFVTSGLQHLGRVLQQIAVEVAHHQHILLPLRLEFVHKAVQRRRLLGAAHIKAALALVHVA